VLTKNLTDQSLGAHALAAILKNNPSWNPHESDEVTISSTTSYVLSPTDVRFRLSAELIEAARRILSDADGCECGKPAAWARRTQFAGDHYFCDEDARRQRDFGKSDPSYFHWERL